MSSSNEELVFVPSRTTLPFSAVSAEGISEDGDVLFSESQQLAIFSTLLESRTLEQASSDFTLSFDDGNTRYSVSDSFTSFSVVSAVGEPSDDFSNLHEGEQFPLSNVVVCGRLSGAKRGSRFGFKVDQELQGVSEKMIEIEITPVHSQINILL